MEVGYIMCQGRHCPPNGKVCRRYHIDPKEGLFPKWIDPFDFKKMDSYLDEKLVGVHKLNLVVTGLSSALLEVCKYCAEHDIDVTCLHYDNATKKYKVQRL